MILYNWWPYKKKKGEREISLFICTYPGKAIWGHSKKEAVYKPRRKFSLELNGPEPWSGNSQPPEVWENKFQLSRPPSHDILWQLKLTKTMSKIKIKWFNEHLGTKQGPKRMCVRACDKRHFQSRLDVGEADFYTPFLLSDSTISQVFKACGQRNTDPSAHITIFSCYRDQTNWFYLLCKLWLIDSGCLGHCFEKDFWSCMKKKSLIKRHLSCTRSYSKHSIHSNLLKIHTTVGVGYSRANIFW